MSILAAEQLHRATKPKIGGAVASLRNAIGIRPCDIATYEMRDTQLEQQST